MIRLLGFLVGSAASVGAILLILGMPDLGPSEPAVTETVADASPPVANATVAEPPSLLPEEPQAERSLPDPVLLPAEDISALPDEVKWHSFWNPFRSEIAANGFVGQLEEVTGFDFRVVKIQTGVYEVAFAYKDDIERRSKLSQIASATGLELPSS